MSNPTHTSQHRAARRAFTLVELLVVITIIAILAGLLFPVFGILRNKAWAARTRNIAEQVARGWAAHRQDFRAYPVTLITALPDVKGDDKDLMFPMTREALNLLNWYGGKNKDFAGPGSAPLPDATREAEWYKLVITSLEGAELGITRPGSVRVKMTAAVTESGKAKEVTVGLREKYFERNETQWLNGLKGAKDNRVIWVKLDTNYDGIVTYTSIDAAGRQTTETVRQVAIAWGVDDTGKNDTVKSW